MTAIVLAAGLGTRMKSSLPKVMHPLAGRPLLHYAVRAGFDAGAERVVVVASAGAPLAASLQAEFDQTRIVTVVQDPPRGTGDAARIGIEQVRTERVLILYGDTPLVRAEELRALVGALDVPGASVLSVMTCTLDQPFGYGRVLRDGLGGVVGIVEERDLRTPGEQAIREVNAGMYAGDTEAVRLALAQLEPNNAQGEYYLTDIVSLLARASRVSAVFGHPHSLLGVNDRAQLREAEELMLERIRRRHEQSGVTVRGAARIDDRVEIGEDSVIEAGVVLRGATRIGARTVVDVGSVLSDAAIGDGVLIKPYTVISASRVGDNAQLGPFAHVRPESELDADVHLGNFVETKKTRLRRGAKANHLAYLGDADVGERTNVGAGTIICNYDGFSKHRTVIGEGAFIGSDSQLVAPVTIGAGAYVATGTTITDDVPADALAIGRARQENKQGYAPKLKARLAAARDAQKKT
ncbi:MAG TPA: bifunctional UDP-N-acetylglucosamine diphosphorylase/glucosamine-1-phosphate N-acetyltransferase GlmU [Polyangiaceae bacterium]